MTLRLSATLRTLRKQAGLTQSALAEALGVSDRAVSRWERGQSLPDVTLLPGLAALLNVSVDALLGVDSQARQRAIQTALSASTEALRRGEPAEATATLRAALQRYPDEPELLVQLARTLLMQATDATAAEALALCRAADGRPARLSTQFGCKQVMALALHHLGKAEQAAQLVSDEMPSMWVCRELLYPRVAPPDKARGQHQFNLLWLADHLRATLQALAAESEPAVAIPLLEASVRCLQEVTAGQAGAYEAQICRARLKLADLHLTQHEPAAALAALRQALRSLDAYAAHTGSYAAPWLRDFRDEPADALLLESLRARCRCVLQETIRAGVGEAAPLLAQIEA